MSFTLEISGVNLPAPSEYTFSEYDLTENAIRNAAGYAQWDVVRTNVGRLDLTFKNISREQIQLIASVIRGKKKFHCTFLNPYTGEMETREFYSGDRSISLTLGTYVSALDYYSTLTIPFVEV